VNYKEIIMRISIAACSVAFIVGAFYSAKILTMRHLFKERKGGVMVLTEAPETIEKYKEIAIQHNKDIVGPFNNLDPEERVLIYYLLRASLPGNRIVADQMHRHALEVIDLFKEIVNNQDKVVSGLSSIDAQAFIDQARTFWVYLRTNHGQYFLREHANAKRTPERLGLDLLTPENLVAALQAVGYQDAEQTIARLTPTLFDHTVESTTCVPNSIKDSAVNPEEESKKCLRSARYGKTNITIIQPSLARI